MRAVAGYNLMNEPVSGAPNGRFTDKYQTDWNAVNRLYRRAVEAVREVDPDHIIFLEGDHFSVNFEKLDPPFAPNLVYSSHNYIPPATMPGKYPGTFDGKIWNKRRQADVFRKLQGTRFARENRVPLWVGEFGAVLTGGSSDAPHRLRALDEQISIFEEHGAHWTIWTYKDIGVMGLLAVKPDSPYHTLMEPVLRAKKTLGTDGWLEKGTPRTPVQKAVERLAGIAERAIRDPDIDHPTNRIFLAQALQAGYFAGLMQPAFAKRFKKLSESQIDKVMQSFAFRNCRMREDLAAVLKKYWALNS
jgi:hypothetical protein